jgi:small subunit ribosomal protein S3Ae
MAKARSRAAARRMKDKWKAKSWYNVLAPASFDHITIAETLADEPNKLINRVTEVSLQDLTNDFRKSHYKLFFKINRVEDTNAYSQYVGHTLTSDYLRRMVRRKRSKIDAVYDVITRDGAKVRIKPFTTTDHRIQNSQKKIIRETMKQTIIKQAKASTLSEFLKYIFDGKIGKDIYQSCKKLYPVKRVEIYKTQVLTQPRIHIEDKKIEQPEEEEKKETESIESEEPTEEPSEPIEEKTKETKGEPAIAEEPIVEEDIKKQTTDEPEEETNETESEEIQEITPSEEEEPEDDEEETIKDDEAEEIVAEEDAVEEDEEPPEESSTKKQAIKEPEQSEPEPDDTLEETENDDEETLEEEPEDEQEIDEEEESDEEEIDEAEDTIESKKTTDETPDDSESDSEDEDISDEDEDIEDTSDEEEKKK